MEGEGRRERMRGAGWGEFPCYAKSTPHPACLRFPPAIDPPPPGEGEARKLRSPFFRLPATLEHAYPRKPFAPDARMNAILERAAKAGRAQMLVAGFASNRPDRFVWPDRKWEYASLRWEN